MRALAILILASPAWAATTVPTIETTSTQALFRYHTTNAGACTVEISESATYTPLVYDVDPALYAGANLDSREPNLQAGGNRVFVAGKRVTQRDLNSIPRSRALETSALHYYRVTCGTDVVTGTFLTRQPPFGLTYPEPIPIDPLAAGETLWPAINYADKTQAYIDPQTGVRIKRVTGPGDQQYSGYSMNVTFGAGNTAFSPASGNSWTAATFPASITGNNTSYLMLRLDTAVDGSGGGVDFYAFNLGASYTTEAFASLNNLQTSITGSVSNAACNTSATDDCKVVVCVSVDGVTCHPSSAMLEVALTTTSQAYTVGDQTFTNMGGWITPGRRPVNSVEAAKRTGTAVCNGTATVTGGPFNLNWTAGSVISINAVTYPIASVQHEAQITLTSACPSGSYSFTGKNFGLLVRAKTVNANTITLTAGSTQVRFGVAPPAPAGANQDICSPTTVNDLNGEPGYNCAVTQGVAWVSAVTGEGRYIIPTWVADASGIHGVQYQMLNFDGSDPDTFYGFSNSGQRFFSYKYKGQHLDVGYPAEAPAPNCNDPVNPTNTPCLVVTELTAGLADFNDLVNAFDRGFDKTKWALYPIGTNPYHGAFELLYKRNDNGPVNNSYAWVAIFDPHATTNSRPGNAGCSGAALGNSNPGCIIGAIPVYARQPMRGVNTKGSTYSNSDTGFIAVGPHFSCENTTQNGGGCWKVDTGGGFAFTSVMDGAGGPTTCPQNGYAITGKNCTQLTVLSEPYDPNPGTGETGAPGEYITSAPGDIFCVNCTTVGGGGTQQLPGGSAELVRLLVKNGNTWWVQRHFQFGFDDGYVCPRSACIVGPGSAQASAANPSLWYSGASGQAYWDFLDDPAGQGMMLDTREQGAHNFMHRGLMVESSVVPTPPCSSTPSGCYMIRYNPQPVPIGVVGRMNPTGFSTAAAPFAGKTGISIINGTQSHPSAAGAAASEENRAMFYDARPFNGIYGSAGPVQATFVSGSLWKLPAGQVALNRKQLPTHATVGVHLLTDVSGPGSSIGTGTADTYHYCVVLAAGECFAGSAAGEIYFNTPNLRYNFCLSPGQASSGADNTDVCIHDQAMTDDVIVQMSAAVGSDNAGVKQRLLTHGFTAPRVNSPFWNIFLSSDSSYGVTRAKFINNYRADLISVKMQPLRFDSRSRNDFQNVPVTVPGSPFGFAEIEWGYLENGTDEATVFVCSSRQDNCRSGGAPFLYASETQAPSACGSGCTIPMPVVANRMVYYRVLRTDAGGNVLARGETRVAAIP